jgi:hypothetical protein
MEDFPQNVELLGTSFSQICAVPSAFKSEESLEQRSENCKFNFCVDEITQSILMKLDWLVKITNAMIASILVFIGRTLPFCKGSEFINFHWKLLRPLKHCFADTSLACDNDLLQQETN